MANLPLAFIELLGGAVLVDAAIKGASIADVVKGQATQKPITGISSGAAPAAGTNVSGPAQAEQMLAAARASLGGHYNQGNHNAVGDTAARIKQLGTDCSGFISYLMGPNGAGLWSASYATPGIGTAPNLQSGQGTYVTIWNNPAPGNAGHVFIDILGQFFESAGGVGVHQMSAAQAQSYLHTGQYQPYHPQGL